MSLKFGLKKARGSVTRCMSGGSLCLGAATEKSPVTPALVPGMYEVCLYLIARAKIVDI